MTSTISSIKSVYMARGFWALARRAARTALAHLVHSNSISIPVAGRWQERRPERLWQLVNDKNDLRQDNYRNAFAVLLCGIAAELGIAPGLAEINRSAARLADIKRHGTS